MKTEFNSIILDIMGVDIPGIDRKTMSVTHLVNHLETVLKGECHGVCTLFNNHLAAVTYGDIQTSSAALWQEMKRQKDRLTALQPLLEGDGAAVAMDDGVFMKYDDLQWLMNPAACLFPQQDTITTPTVLSQALYALAYGTIDMCQRVMKEKEEMLKSPDGCLMLLEHYEDAAYPTRSVLIKKQIELLNLKGQSRGARAYREKMDGDMEANPLFQYTTDYLYHKGVFAQKVATTKGITRDHLETFLYAMQLHAMINSQTIRLPWLKEAYHHRIDDIAKMLRMGYDFLTVRAHLSSSDALAVLLLWMQDGIRLSHGTTTYHAMLYYTEYMNHLLDLNLTYKSVKNRRCFLQDTAPKYFQQLDFIAVMTGLKDISQ